MNKNKKLARICLMIPVLIMVVLAICFVAACALEHPTDRGMVYTAFAMIAILGSVFAPIPSIRFSIAGLAFAVKARKEEHRMNTFIIIGIVEIVLAILCGAYWLFIIFIGGASV